MPLPKRRHNVMLVSDFFSPRVGGVETHIYRLALSLLALGHKVIVVTRSVPAPKQPPSTSLPASSPLRRPRIGVRYLSSLLLKVYYLPILELAAGTSVPTFLVSGLYLRSIMRREQISIVHTHQATSVLGIEAALISQVFPTPTSSFISPSFPLHHVSTDHSLFALNDVAGIHLNAAQSLTHNGSASSRHIAVSYATASNLLHRYGNADAERISVIPNAVDPAIFCPSPKGRAAAMHASEPSCRSRYSPHANIVIVVVSRLVYRKGADLLASIIPHLCSSDPRLSFLIGGSGPKSLLLDEMISAHNLQSRVTLLGELLPSSVPATLRRGHIFLNVSLTESFCIALLEAACCGCVCVATKVGGVPEVLPSRMVVYGGGQGEGGVGDDGEGRGEGEGSDANLGDTYDDDVVRSMIKAVKEGVKRVDEIPDMEEYAWGAYDELKGMYTWDAVGEMTEKVYDSVVDSNVGKEREREGAVLFERIKRWLNTDGGSVGGIVSVFVALTLYFWFRLLDFFLDPVETCWSPHGDQAVVGRSQDSRVEDEDVTRHEYAAYKAAEKSKKTGGRAKKGKIGSQS